MATPSNGEGISARDLADMGIGEFTEEVAESYGVDMSDADTAALIASFEELRPDPAKLLAEHEARLAAAALPPEPPVVEIPPVPGDAPLDPPAPGTAQPEPTGEPVLPPPTGEPAPAPTPVVAPSTESYVVDLGNGGTAELDQATARSLVQLGQWANGLTPAVREAFNAVESGQAVPIPRDDYLAFQAWKAAGSRPAPTTATSSAPSTTAAPPFDPEDASPAELAMWAELQAVRAQGDAQFQAQVQAQQATQAAQLQQVIAQRGEAFNAEWVTAGAEMNLTPTEINQALQYAGETRTIAQVNQELTTFSPTGQVLTEADPAAIAREVLNRAVYAIPSLRAKALQAQVDARLETERADIIRTNEKKNRAGSLASAPSAATTSGRDVRTMTPQQREAAIAEVLRSAMNDSA